MAFIQAPIKRIDDLRVHIDALENVNRILDYNQLLKKNKELMEENLNLKRVAEDDTKERRRLQSLLMTCTLDEREHKHMVKNLGRVLCNDCKGIKEFQVSTKLSKRRTWISSGSK